MIRIDIINDKTGTPQTGNYNYIVHLPGRVLKGRITGHNRALGWAELVNRVVEKADMDRASQELLEEYLLKMSERDQL